MKGQIRDKIINWCTEKIVSRLIIAWQLNVTKYTLFFYKNV